MLATLRSTARPICQRATSLVAIRTDMRIGANGGSNERAVTRGVVGSGRATNTSR
jgi:hypothetical protein